MHSPRLLCRYALLLLGLALASTAAANAQSKSIAVAATGRGRRIALVIGNADYPGRMQLRNPIHDARAMAAKLRVLGFQVTEQENLNGLAMRVAIDAFAGRLGPNDVGLFYYSGHGAAFGGESYLIPVDANASSAAYLKNSSVPLQQVLGDMKQAGNGSNFVLLDACRNTPALVSRGYGGGLAQPRNVPVGTFIGFATAPGETAEDGTGLHGPFTKALLDHLSTPGITADQVFHRVVAEVYSDTDEQQRPWSQSSLTQDFYFNGSPEPPGPTQLSATASGTIISLQFAGSKGATSYDAYYSTTNDLTTSNGTKLSNVTSDTPLGVPFEPDTTYYFIVTGLNRAGEGAASNTASATTQAPPVLPVPETSSGAAQRHWGIGLMIGGGLVALLGYESAQSAIDSANTARTNNDLTGYNTAKSNLNSDRTENELGITIAVAGAILYVVAPGNGESDPQASSSEKHPAWQMTVLPPTAPSSPVLVAYRLTW